VSLISVLLATCHLLILFSLLATCHLRYKPQHTHWSSLLVNLSLPCFGFRKMHEIFLKKTPKCCTYSCLSLDSWYDVWKTCSCMCGLASNCTIGRTNLISQMCSSASSAFPFGQNNCVRRHFDWSCHRCKCDELNKWKRSYSLKTVASQYRPMSGL
jgi:hypothetical protein